MIFVRHPYSPPPPPGLFPQGSQCKITLICQRRTSVAHEMRGRKESSVFLGEFPDELNGGETDEQQGDRVMSSAALVHGPLALFTSCSSRVAITFFVNNIEFSLSNAQLLSFSSFLFSALAEGSSVPSLRICG